jgi:hypothetical protein
MMTNVLSLIIFTITISSTNGAYFADVVYSGGTELITASFKLYDHNGNMLYHIINPEAITFFISNTGEVFATNEQALFLYRRDGEVKFLRKLNYPNGFSFSPDNTYFFASDRDGIYGYSMSGKLTFQYNPGRLFASTENAKKFVVVSNDSLFYYERGDLKFVRKVSSPFVRKVYFSDESTIKVELPDTTELIKLIKED